ncbi:hypothetical protein H8E88_08580 [candidate division KSB1 bacterium]|nr:hypothetical protein [candidate division KSB1 bacterium]
MKKPRKIKVKFKHHPSPPTSGCTKPFGLCIIIPINFAEDVTPEEYAEGYGIADCEVVNEQFHMIFNRRAALDDGTIPIENNWNLGEEIARGFGYSEIIIQSGDYNVNFSNYPEFGEVFFNANLN